MSSFKRRTPSKASSASKAPTGDSNPDQPPPPTAEPSLLSGLTSLDDLLGFNGLPRGHALLIRTPDPHSAWGLMLSRYSLAQGLVSGDAVVVIAREDDAKDLIAGCMWTSDAVDDVSADAEDADPDVEPEGGVKIAWRYAKMKQFSTTIPKRATSRTGLNQESAAFDLTMRIPTDVVAHSQQIGQLTTIPLPETYASNNSPCHSILNHIQKLIQEIRSESATPTRRAVRIVIPDLGNPAWGDLQPQDLVRFLLALRSLLRGTSAAAFITLCSTLSADSWGGPGWPGKLSHLSDGCITFAGFGDDPTAPLSFPTHHGLVKISASPSPGTLRAPSISKSVLRGMNSSGPHGGGENNLAFRCTRKRLIIETMHLGAEGGVGARQTAPPPNAAIQLDSHPHPAPKPTESARINIALDNGPNLTVEASQEGTKTSKKGQRRVLFQSDKPEIYDF
ncbi:hypothetical protein FRC08_000055 [Ceratobasidium sp. 394]|nr:hypothetical protein FRC08_000055 [Ceratobasidium sp. 394]KAG9076726.1 hypothetical protein FS749_011447 [Ceratobasidium sp. UAMH 11750]